MSGKRAHANWGSRDTDKCLLRRPRKCLVSLLPHSPDLHIPLTLSPQLGPFSEGFQNSPSDSDLTALVPS